MRLSPFKLGPALRRVEYALNKVVDAVNANRLAKSFQYRLKETSNGTTLDIPIPPAGEVTATSVRQFRIKSIADDYITAAEWDGSAEGTQRQIAKPWRLRKTGWDGVLVNYNFNGANFPLRYTYLSTPGFRSAFHANLNQTENQAIIPIYRVSDIIYATEPEGGTLVTVGGTALTWLDLNVDARAWARY